MDKATYIFEKLSGVFTKLPGGKSPADLLVAAKQIKNLKKSDKAVQALLTKYPELGQLTQPNMFLRKTSPFGKRLKTPNLDMLDKNF